MKALLIFGTRPEAVKLAPVYSALRHSGRHQVRVCVTGQHREMLDDVLGLFQIKADHDLDLMRPNQNLFDFTAASLSAIGGVLREERPDVVLVQGDTSTVLTAALGSYYLQIPVAHVEAGLRTGDRLQPFPEEANRKLCDVLSNFLFAPTSWAKGNLLQEGYPEERVYVTGNTVIDSLVYMIKRVGNLTQPPGVPPELMESLAGWVNEAGRVVLVTGHRRESFGDGIRQIALALKDISHRNQDVCIIYPVHLNPNIQGPVRAILHDTPRVHLVPPLPYDAFVWLMERSFFILTDSGGIQEEAPTLGRPVLVMRNKTERPEAIEAGTARLVGNRSESIVAAAQALLDDHDEYSRMARTANPFGDGRASERIVGILEKELDS